MKNNFHFHKGCIRKSHFFDKPGNSWAQNFSTKIMWSIKLCFLSACISNCVSKMSKILRQKRFRNIPHQQIPRQLHPRKLMWEQQDNHLKMWCSFKKNNGFPAHHVGEIGGGISRSTWIVSSISSSKTFLGQALQRQGLSPIPPTFSRRKIPLSCTWCNWGLRYSWCIYLYY